MSPMRAAPPPCLTAPVSWSTQGSPSPGLHGLDWNPRSELFRFVCAALWFGDVVAFSSCSIITEVMRSTSSDKFFIVMEPLIRRVVRPPFTLVPPFLDSEAWKVIGLVIYYDGAPFTPLILSCVWLCGLCITLQSHPYRFGFIQFNQLTNQEVANVLKLLQSFLV